VVFALVALGVASCRTAGDSAGTERPQLDFGAPKPHTPWQATGYASLKVTLPEVSEAEFVNDDEFCAMCHKAYVEAFAHNVHRQGKCESCHGPASRHVETRGKEPGLILSFKTMQPAQRSEACLKCHAQDGCAPGATWRTSAHANQNVACTDCHKNHYNVPQGTPATTLAADIMRLPHVPTVRLVASQEAESELPSLAGTSHNLGAVAPDICYRCHGEKTDLQEIAGPHQIGGPNCFNCTTCHDPHGNVVESSRKELCLQCHNTTPIEAWHSSTHDQVGVACTDCHNPHPSSSVQQLVNMSHTSLQRPKRLPMSVDEPQACYKCHPKIRGRTLMPSHHPIREGKVTCSDCHDPHGQSDRNLRDETVNLVCYKCHAEKQGPFVYEHPPVEQDCTICHDPHGTVAYNLLRQPPTFLCLRCHTGHRSPPADHFGQGVADIDGNRDLRPALYTNCTQCHSQIHGSDLPSQHRAGALMR
jgi:DmsE family decaheme c-type cytochrome